MWDRYTGAFVAEMQAFADAVINDKETPVTGEDGLYPVLMAAAATKSLHEGRPVKISRDRGFNHNLISHHHAHSLSNAKTVGALHQRNGANLRELEQRKCYSLA